MPVLTQPSPIRDPERSKRRCSLTPLHSLFMCGRLRARTPSGGSGPRTAAALRTLPREQLRVRAGGGKPPPPPGATPFFDGRAYGPPLCGGTPPATPPSKTIAHQPYAVIPTVRLIQAGGGQPNTQKNSPNGGGDEELAKTGTVYGSIATKPGEKPSTRCTSPDAAPRSHPN